MPAASDPGLLGTGVRARLGVVLTRAQELGFLGPGPVAEHVELSLGLLPMISEERLGPAARAMDLGSGGGVPGLVLAAATPGWSWVLLDGSVKRTAALEEAVEALGLGDRVTVVAGRAEEVGRGALRATRDVVVSRGFGPPPVTAECGAAFLCVGGRLVVTEPPGGAPDRWDRDGLQKLGLELGERQREPVAAQTLRCVELLAERFPRRVGIPAKRPLW